MEFCASFSSPLYLILAAILHPNGEICLFQGPFCRIDTYQTATCVCLCLPSGLQCSSRVLCHSCALRSVKQEQISFHTLAFLAFRWRLLSWRMSIMLLSPVAAMTAALTVHRCKGHSVDLCDSLWLAKRYQVEGPKQKQFSGAEGNILRSSELHFFPPPTFPLHEVWSWTHSLCLNSSPLTACGLGLNTDFLSPHDVYMK